MEDKGTEKDILSTIVALEREIEERLVAEERRSGQFLCELKQQIDHESVREEERLKAALQQTVAAAEEEARERAADIVHGAAARAGRLTALDEGELERFIMRHLVRLVPGE